eukprot:GFYU01005854.1.p1 GENE.GFYU01005854.1~~GFYU01005854.1.p1  ORF type:complete len:863 (+),score=176.65 GFYU01005854.1:383-2590(+)
MLFGFVLTAFVTVGLLATVTRTQTLDALVKSRASALEETNEALVVENERRRAVQDALLVEREATDRLLLSILPRAICERLKSVGTNPADVIADRHDNVTIFFLDLVGFTRMSADLQPTVIVQTLNTLFSVLDNLCVVNGLEKIKTIGDSYMAVCGAPNSCEDHAVRVASFAIDSMLAVNELNARSSSMSKITVEARMGIHSGPVVAGVLGSTKFAYDIWGDAVNTASRMESTAPKGSIQVSEYTASLIHGKGFQLSKGHTVEVKGKGRMRAHILEGRSIESVPRYVADAVSKILIGRDPIIESLVEKTVSVIESPSDPDNRTFAALLTDLHEWDAKFTELDVKSQGHSMMVVGTYIFHKLNLAEDLALPLRTVAVMMLRIEQRTPDNMFHNKQWVASILHSMYVTLEACDLNLLMDTNERVGLFLACVLSGMGHPGWTNENMVRDRHPMALSHYDFCPVEQNAIAQFTRLSETDSAVADVIFMAGTGGDNYWKTVTVHSALAGGNRHFLERFVAYHPKVARVEGRRDRFLLLQAILILSRCNHIAKKRSIFVRNELAYHDEVAETGYPVSPKEVLDHSGIEAEMIKGAWLTMEAFFPGVFTKQTVHCNANVTNTKERGLSRKGHDESTRTLGTFEKKSGAIPQFFKRFKRNSGGGDEDEKDEVDLEIGHSIRRPSETKPNYASHQQPQSQPKRLSYLDLDSVTEEDDSTGSEALDSTQDSSFDDLKKDLATSSRR